MKKFLTIVLAACAIGTLAIPAARAAEMASESRPIDARITRINIDGPIGVRIKQGATPALTVFAEQRYLPNVSTEQSGDVLHIGAELHNVHTGFGKGQVVRIELTLPSLREVISCGVGPSYISGFSGETMNLSLDGVGAINFSGQYRQLTARLGGVGDLNINAGDSELVTIHHPGLGRVALSGQTRKLQADLSGVGNLDAKPLVSDNVNLNLNGLGNATVYAKTSVHLTLNGLGSVTVYGQPAERNVTVNSMGKVSWK
jgi:hypothetical protein